MLARALLQTSLVLWLVQNTIQGGVRPQAGAMGRLAPSRAAGILGARAYGLGKPGKTAAGRHLGVGAYRPTGIAAGLKQGYGALGYGAGNLGTGLGASYAGAGLGVGRGFGQGNGLGAALGYQGYAGNGYGAPLGYGVGGYPGAGRGYGIGAGGYLGTGLPDGYGAGLGAGGYPQGVRGGKHIAGYSNGYGSEMYGAADGYGAGLGLGQAGLGVGGLGAAGLGHAGHGAAGFGSQGLFGSAGLGADAKSRKYGGAGAGALDSLVAGVGQLPYSAPVIAAGLEGDAGYPYGAEQLSLGSDVAKTAAKFGGAGGFGAALSTGSQGAYAGQKDASKSNLGGVYGNGYKG